MEQSRKIYRLFLLSAAVWCSLIVLAPLARVWGLEELSSLLYHFFSRVCHQLGERSFHVSGESFGVCARCTSIYFSFLASLILFPLFTLRRRRSSLPLPRAVLFVALAPMAIDVILSLIGVHASSVFTRVVTGTLSGFVLPWFILPPLFEAVHQLRTSRGGVADARETL